MAHDPMIGQRLERYAVLALLGEGGMGAVYRGRDTVLKRDVALKFMHAQYARKAEFQQRFLNEAQATAQLDHPGIVKVYDYRQDGDYLYIVMEYIAGGNLSQMLQDLRAKQQWLSIREAVQLVRQVSLALDYAHRKGVLHRDIKPANIMIKPEPAGELPYQPVITDLGLARLGEGLGLTQTGTSMGTPSYMSPEQALGKAMDARSDVYSLGILLYELAVGQRPFNIKSLSEAMRIHPVEEPPRPSSLRPGLPAALEQVILRALKKEPAARYQSAAALAGDLGKLEPASAAAAPPPTAAAGTVPLMTQYQESVLALRGPSLVEELPAVSAVADSLQLRSPDGKVRTLPLAAKVVTVGRASDNTVPLDDPKVSQHHLRIEYDGSRYRVTDLKSTNGTYMGAVKLLSGVPEVWEPQKPLRVGAHHLLLVVAAGRSSSSSATEYESVGSYLGAAGLLQVVKPGEQVSVPLVLHNATRQVDYLALVVEGVPPAWVGPLKPANLHPEQQQDATVTLRPPAAPESRAGDYAVQIYAASRNTGQKTLVQALTLRVLSVPQVSSALEPETVRAGRAASVVLQNTGNAPQRFQVAWRDPEQALQFHPTQAQLVVEPGQRGLVKYTARPRRRRWFGSSLAHPLTVTVVTDGGTAAEHHGTLQSSSLLPVWVPLLLLLLLAALGAFIFNQLGNREKEQQVAQATTAALALAADDDGDGLPNVAEAQLGIDPAKPDTDGDGLNDKKEVDLGTDPQKPDTDGDGLNDGQEIRYAANPQVLDTDGDTLADGVEVKNGTSPTKDDTDGDGLKDNVDPDPLQPPTPTPPPHWTATAEMEATQTSVAVNATLAAVAADRTTTAVAARATDQAVAAERATSAAANDAMIAAAQTQNALQAAAAAAAAAAATAASQPTSTPTPALVAPVPTPAPAPQPELPAVRLDMVTVPGGSFVMGSGDADIQAVVAECNATEGNCREEWFDSEKPSKTVSLGTYNISKYEVTNAQYNACVNAGACQTAGQKGTDGTIPFDPGFFAASMPVVGVTWQDANTFCTWAGGRLPTEEEWEKAARGASDQRRYPWGDQFDAARANLTSGYPAVVGSYPAGASPYGIMDMSGNVFEWTATNVGGKYVLRGGGWHNHYFRGRVTDRGTKLPPDFNNYDIGFRCAG